ncbi:MAG: c-type cytochrome [Gemmatimonadota bacterium]
MRRREGRRRRIRRRIVALVVGDLLAAGVAGCDNQLKYVPWFSSMSRQPAVETFEEPPRPPVEGTVPVDGHRTYTLVEADTALFNPLRATAENVSRGQTLFGQFCTPCHGTSGRGDGPVILSERRPRGIPGTPAMNLHSETARDRSDGYIWGVIAEGRGLMPSYRRIPPGERWHLVLYVRHLQQTGGAGAAVAAPRAGESGAGARTSETSGPRPLALETPPGSGSRAGSEASPAGAGRRLP